MHNVIVDCSSLDASDVDELSLFLMSLPGVDVPVTFVTEADSDSVEVLVAEGDAGTPSDVITFIHASHTGYELAVQFTTEHWKTITGGATAVASVYKAYKWISERITEWNKTRDEKYDLVPLYDQDANVVSVVKRLRTTPSPILPPKGK